MTSTADMKTEARREALRRFMRDRGLKAKPWAKDAGVSDGVIRNFLNGLSDSIATPTLEKLAIASDATVAEIIGEKMPVPRVGKDVVAIKSLQVRASMGGGFEVVEEPEGPPYFFRRAWIEKVLDGEYGMLRVIPDLMGDSMLPTIAEHDMGLVMLPGPAMNFQSGKVYAIWDGQGLIVKRIESIVGADRPRLRIISDNASVYPAYEVDADSIRIIGRMIWRGGAI
jgi:phage repressor protein C with HTH and peptisase S24 domain